MRKKKIITKVWAEFGETSSEKSRKWGPEKAKQVRWGVIWDPEGVGLCVGRGCLSEARTQPNSPLGRKPRLKYKGHTFWSSNQLNLSWIYKAHQFLPCQLDCHDRKWEYSTSLPAQTLWHRKAVQYSVCSSSLQDRSVGLFERNGSSSCRRSEPLHLLSYGSLMVDWFPITHLPSALYLYPGFC